MSRYGIFLIVSIIFAVGAVTLALLEKGGWGWFMFASVITFPSFGGDD